MRILIAPDSFKESLSATEVAHAIAQGIRNRDPSIEIDLCPIADGGEGTIDALVTATGGQIRFSKVTGPLNQPVEALWGWLPESKTAVIEMAQAAGLALVPPDQRNPLHTTTFGVGELILTALDDNPAKLIIAIGGSATNDGGVGMAQALGIKFPALESRAVGADLPKIRAIDISIRDPRLARAKILVACDVQNPLFGPEGAAAVYGPQKGATPSTIAQLDAGLMHLATLLPNTDPNAPGMGAAGGMGFGLKAFLNAELTPGIDLVLDTVHFQQRLQNTDLVITGEGKLDAQSLSGKACLGVASAAQKQNIKTIALVGDADLSASQTLQHGIGEYHTLVSPTVTSEQAMENPSQLLADLAQRVIKKHLI